MGDDSVMSLGEAATKLGISRTTAWRMIRDGRLRSERSELDLRFVLVYATDVDRLAAQKVGFRSRTQCLTEPTPPPT